MNHVQNSEGCKDSYETVVTLGFKQYSLLNKIKRKKKKRSTCVEDEEGLNNPRKRPTGEYSDNLTHLYQSIGANDGSLDPEVLWVCGGDRLSKSWWGLLC